MQQTHALKRFCLALAVAVGATPLFAQQPGADPVGLRGDIGGLWFSPASDGQGLQIDVLDGGRVALTWYTFDADGEPLWLFGLGKALDGAVEVDLSRASGGRFITLPAQEAPQFSAAGRLRVDFAGCTKGTLRYTDAGAGLPDGQVALERLSSAQGARCNAEEEFAEQRILSFERGSNGFTPLFADLPRDGQEIYELDFAWEQLPDPLAGRRGLRLTGHNRSDDLAMLIRAPLQGLMPDTSYHTEIELELASSVPSGCAGVGGSPGESVYVKLGALGFAPDALVVDEGGVATLRLNFGYGQQSEGGEHALVVGNLSNTQDCENGPDGEWELKTLSTAGQDFVARTDAQGRLWVVAGIDSAFEGLTHVYFTALRVRLRPITESS